MSIRQAVIDAICSVSDRKFHINEIRELCAKSCPSLTRKQLQSNVYKAVWGLKQEGHLECHIDEENNRNNLYEITAIGLEKFCIERKTVIESPTKKDEPLSDIHQKLTVKLSVYSKELATYSSEAQEYEELSKQFPQLSSVLHEKYMRVKQKALVLTGRVTALESVLQEIKS